MQKTLIVMDLINEIVNPNGKLASKGYSNFWEQNNSIENINRAIEKFRSNGRNIIFIKLGFSNRYEELPLSSPIFGKAKEFGILQLGTWSTEIYELIDYKNDITITKHRVNSFYGTDLEIYLKNTQTKDIYLCGCATDLVVESTARDGHDRDYGVYILEDCCIAANIEDHQRSITNMKKFANIIGSKDL